MHWEETMKKPMTILFGLMLLTGLMYSQSIQLVQPNGGELVIGSDYPIMWTASNTSNPFKITLWRNGTLVGTIRSTVAAGNGNHEIEWVVGDLEGGIKAPVGDGYKVKVKEKTVTVSDSSDAPFKIKFAFAPLGTTAAKILPPDLKISIICTPESPAVHGKLAAKFLVENIGRGSSVATRMRVFMGQTNTDTWPVPSLKPGRHYSMTKKLNPSGVGYIAWAADVDDEENNKTDTNRSNNFASKKTIIRGPDLKITRAWTPDYKKTIQQKCTLHVTVKNIGHADAPRFELDADMDTCKGIAHGRDYKVHEGGLKPGESVTFTFTHRYACFKMVGVDLYVDKANEVKEENESNNTCGVPFHISGENVGSGKSPWSTNCP